MQKIKLCNRIEMPILGLGCYSLNEKEITNAIQVGYRLLDTAIHYGNENQVGLAIRKSGLPREDFFVTTKLMRVNFRSKNTMHALVESLNRMETEYVDLLLAHFPPEPIESDAWKDLEAIYYSGKVRAIGVSNYSIENLERTLEHATIKPCVNQIKINPYSYDIEVIDFCKKNGICVEAYSPLGGEREVRSLLKEEILIQISQKYDKTIPQIIIRWLLQMGFIAIPRSKKLERLIENIGVFSFELNEDDMADIALLRRG